MGGGLCTVCDAHGGERPGICCCFYGTTDSLCSPPQTPTASVWLDDCVCVHYEKWSWCRVCACGGGGSSLLPLCVALFCHFQLNGGGVSGNGFEFQANLRPQRENKGCVSGAQAKGDSGNHSKQ